MKRTLLRPLAAVVVAGFTTLAVPTQVSVAQQAPTVTPVRTVLALASLPSLVEAPLYFRLSKVELAASKTTSYSGPVGFIYALSGSVLGPAGAGRHSLRVGDALLLEAGKVHSLTAVDSEPAVLLHYVLAPSSELDRAAPGESATVTELYRTAAPIPHLKPGPYEFSLTRVSFPPRMAANAPHYRSGAALYYILSGSGLFMADGKPERKEMGTPHFEPHGWVHQWGNDGDTPLVLLQANISEEGVPAVIFGQPPSTPGR
jgi:quercetin dioxygenase-like cupin family protein